MRSYFPDICSKRSVLTTSNLSSPAHSFATFLLARPIAASDTSASTILLFLFQSPNDTPMQPEPQHMSRTSTLWSASFTSFNAVSTRVSVSILGMSTSSAVSKSYPMKFCSPVIY